MFTNKKKQPDKSNKQMLGDEILKREACTKFLGIYVDEQLTWNENIYHYRANY